MHKKRRKTTNKTKFTQVPTYACYKTTEKLCTYKQGNKNYENHLE